MSLKWNDSLAIAGCLNDHPKHKDQDLTGLDSDTLEQIILLEKIMPQPLEKNEARQNILHSILWHWIRLRGEAAEVDRNRKAGR